MRDDKKQLIREAISHHIGSARAVLTGLPVWVWPLPLVLGLVIILVTLTPAGWMTTKPTQEIVAPVVIGLAAALSFIVHRWVGETFTLLLAVFAWSLFARELHFYGTNNGAYIAIAVLAWLASSKRDAIADYLRQTPVAVLLGGAMLTYVVTKVLDRGYLSFLPGYQDWHHNVEETMETSGHLMVFALVVITFRIGSLRAAAGTAAGADQPHHSGPV